MRNTHTNHTHARQVETPVLGHVVPFPSGIALVALLATARRGGFAATVAQRGANETSPEDLRAQEYAPTCPRRDVRGGFLAAFRCKLLNLRADDI